MGQHKDLDPTCPSFRVLRVSHYTSDAAKQRHQDYGLIWPSSRIAELGHDQCLRVNCKCVARQCGPNSIYYWHDGACGGFSNEVKQASRNFKAQFFFHVDEYALAAVDRVSYHKTFLAQTSKRECWPLAWVLGQQFTNYLLLLHDLLDPTNVPVSWLLASWPASPDREFNKTMHVQLSLKWNTRGWPAVCQKGICRHLRFRPRLSHVIRPCGLSNRNPVRDYCSLHLNAQHGLFPV